MTILSTAQAFVTTNPYALAARSVGAVVWRFLPWVLAGAMAVNTYADFAIKGPLGIGFHLEGWKPMALRLEDEKQAAKAAYRAEVARRATIGTEYEREASNAAQIHTIREREIETIYRDVLVPAECAVPDDVRRVLSEAVAASNSAASGQPVSPLPAPADAAGPVD
jgi:hypothetical protein